MGSKKRCKWCNLNNALYVDYHDKEWCIPNFDDTQDNTQLKAFIIRNAYKLCS